MFTTSPESSWRSSSGMAWSLVSVQRLSSRPHGVPVVSVALPPHSFLFLKRCSATRLLNSSNFIFIRPMYSWSRALGVNITSIDITSATSPSAGWPFGSSQTTLHSTRSCFLPCVSGFGRRLSSVLRMPTTNDLWTGIRAGTLRWSTIWTWPGWTRQQETRKPIQSLPLGLINSSLGRNRRRPKWFAW